MAIPSKKTRTDKLRIALDQAEHGSKTKPGEGFKKGLTKFGRKPARSKAEQIIMKHKDEKAAAAKKKKKATAKKK